MKITIEAHDVLYNGLVLPSFARIYCNEQFINSDDETVIYGDPSGTNYIKQVAVTNSAGVATIAPFSGANRIDSTVDSNGVTISTYALSLHDSAGRLLVILYPSIKIPLTPTTTSWDDLIAYLHLPNQPMRYDYYTKAEIDRQLLAYTSTALNASIVTKGVTRLSTTPVDPNTPIAVGDTDTRLPVNITTYGDELFEAVDAIGSTETVLQITRPVAVDANLTVPANISLDVQGTGLIVVSGGNTLTIGNLQDPGNRQIFSGGGTVKFAAGAVERMNIAWRADSADVTAEIDELLLSCADNGGGTIFFPEGEWQTRGRHVIPTGTVIEGCNAAFAGELAAAGGSRIVLVDDGRALFTISDSFSNGIFRNIHLDGDSQTTTTGVLCEGTYPNSSGGLRFENVTINYFTDGFYLHSLPAASQWQFAQISFSNCSFSSNSNSAVRCNTVNTGLSFDSCIFGVLVGGWVFDLANCGTFNAIGCEFAGLSGTASCDVNGIPGATMAEGVVRTTGQHLPLNFVGCQDEGFRYFIYNTASDGLYSSFNLSGCLVQSIIMLTASCVVNSINSNYRSKTFKDSGFTDSRIVSIGDHVQATDLCGNVVSPPELTDFSAGSIVVMQTDFFADTITHRLPVAVESTLETEQFSLTETQALTPFGTAAMDCLLSNRWTITPSNGVTINASNVVAGKKYYLTVLTSGVSSFVITFGTAFKSTGTLATGVVSGKYFIVEFYSPDTTNIIEVKRTTAL